MGVVDVKALAETAGSELSAGQDAGSWKRCSQEGTNSRNKSRVVSVMVSGPSTRFRQDGTSSTESMVTLTKANLSFACTRKYSSVIRNMWWKYRDVFFSLN